MRGSDLASLGVKYNSELQANSEMNKYRREQENGSRNVRARYSETDCQEHMSEKPLIPSRKYVYPGEEVHIGRYIKMMRTLQEIFFL